MKKITRTTIKNFVRNNQGNLFICVKSHFDGMTDGLAYNKGGFRKAEPTSRDHDCTLGIDGNWMVGGGRDYFTAYEDAEFTGYEISNCCGHQILAIRKAV